MIRTKMGHGQETIVSPMTVSSYDLLVGSEASSGRRATKADLSRTISNDSLILGIGECSSTVKDGVRMNSYHHSSSSPPSSESEEGLSPPTNRNALMTYLEPTRVRRRSTLLDNCSIRANRFNVILESSGRLYGRDSEQETLRECFERAFKHHDDVAQDETKTDINGRGSCTLCELLFIDGVSGSGKTALAMTLEPLTEKKKGLFVKGKFDQFNQDCPFQGITAAFLEICNKLILLSSSEDTREMYQAIQVELNNQIRSEEMALLVRIIPELSVVVGGIDGIQPLQDTDIGSGEMNERFKYRLFRVFCVFTRTIARCLAPLVIILDDLHWAGKDTFELLEALSRDCESESTKLLLVGIYRSDEVGKTHPLTGFLENLQERNDSHKSVLTTVSICNLNSTAVNEVLMDLLSEDNPSVTIRLAEACHRRTLGNPFFLIRFLLMLRKRRLIKFNLGSYRWEWDDREVIEATIAAENVVEMLRNNFNNVPSFVSNRLSVAACLGSFFDASVLEVVWSGVANMFRNSAEEGSLGSNEQFFQIAVEEGFVEKVSETAYQWVHDKLQEAALSLVPRDMLSALKVCIGEILLNKLDSRQMETLVFVIANLMNDGACAVEGVDRVMLANLNLLAAKKSLLSSAFEGAEKYCSFGIRWIQDVENQWSTQYHLSVDLHSCAAEANFCLGKNDSMMRICEEVLSNTDSRPLLDTLRVRTVVIQYTACSMKYEEASDLTIGLLRRLDIKLPKRKCNQLFSIAKGILGARRKIKSLSLHAINTTSIEPKNVEILKLLAQLTMYSYFTASKVYFPLAVLKAFEITLKHGASEYSPLMFTLLGMMLCGIVKDYEMGAKCGKIALQLLDQLGCERAKCKTLMVSGTVIRCWSEPTCKVHGVFMEAYKVGLATGDIENAAHSIRYAIHIGTQVGFPLRQLEADVR
mmetsp:Transcript_9260/g.14834  ORF Transcript_9260/g.14834 Transcript_9260/m.14834 type:complete len:927 (+) Transcript_9260:139-2919(+)